MIRDITGGNTNTMGFGAEIKSKKERRVGDVLAEVRSEDLLKFGLIPEFIGRLPVVSMLDGLTEEDGAVIEAAIAAELAARGLTWGH